MNRSTHRLPATGILLALLISLVAGTAFAAPGDIVITEIMQNPAALADADGEWFEIHNVTAGAIDIEGWTIADLGSNTHTIANGAPLMVPAGAYVVLARNAAGAAGEGITALYEYGGSIALGNSDDELILTDAGSIEIDRVEWDGGASWPDPTGASMMWDEATGDNNVGANWAAATATTIFGSGDYGTPGAANGTPALQPPHVANLMHRSLLPEPGETAAVTCDVTDSDGTVTGATIEYTVDTVLQSPVVMSSGGGDAWTGTIPALSSGQVVEYYVIGTDSDALADTSTTLGYTVAAETVTSIASIHADSTGFDGTVVMIQGQIYIPGDYQADGTSVSAFVQDASGRGLNVYGTFVSTGMADLYDTTNIVKVTGTLDWYFDTVEIVRYEVELVSTGNPALTPTSFGTGAAAAFANVGTYVSSTGPITAIATTTGTNPAHNFTIDDGSGPLVIRIDDDVVAGLDTWLVGDVLVAAGAGSQYNSQGQILVGLATDVVNNGQGPDLTPPTLTGASLTAPTEVTLQFSEGIDATTGNDAANYSVYETATPANTTTVTAAVVQVDSTKVVLTLAASISGIDNTVSVSTVEDLAGNPIVTNSTAAIVEPGEVNIVINEIMQNPLILGDADGEWFEVYNAGADPVDMEGWTIKDDGTDSHVIANGAPLVIAPGEYAVFGVNATIMALEGVTLKYQYSGIAQGNSADELVLLDGTLTEIDRVMWDGGTLWPDPTGASMQYKGTGDNNDGTNWQTAAVVFGTGDFGTPGAVNDMVSAVPDAEVTALRGNHPNPFNPQTKFSFFLENDDQVTLQVFNVRGRLVKTVVDARLTAGSYEGVYSWDGRDQSGRPVTSGTYLFRMKTGSGYEETRKMALLK
ncbi:MAG: T9SS type A sorting domain-containing protein [bacterium]|nr:T9SS type A sorting domain-containing protein [bacterium]